MILHCKSDAGTYEYGHDFQSTSSYLIVDVVVGVYSFDICDEHRSVSDAISPDQEIQQIWRTEKKFQANELESAYDRHPGRNTQ